jgi:hypothetical protein
LPRGPHALRRVRGGRLRSVLLRTLAGPVGSSRTAGVADVFDACHIINASSVANGCVAANFCTAVQRHAEPLRVRQVHSPPDARATRSRFHRSIASAGFGLACEQRSRDARVRSCPRECRDERRRQRAQQPDCRVRLLSAVQVSRDVPRACHMAHSACWPQLAATTASVKLDAGTSGPAILSIRRSSR